MSKEEIKEDILKDINRLLSKDIKSSDVNEMFNNIPDTKLNISQPTPQQIPQQMPQQMPQQIPQQIPQQMPQYFSNGYIQPPMPLIPQNMSGQVNEPVHEESKGFLSYFF